MVPAVVEYGTFPVMGVVVFIKKELGVEKGQCACGVWWREFCAACLIYQSMYMAM